MSVTVGWLLLNAAYLIYTVSGLFKDMLRLRIVWMVSTLFFLSHGIVDRLWPAVWWNIPVLLVHTWMITSLVRERRGVNLDEEAEAIRTLLFPDLDRFAFSAMWSIGTDRNCDVDVVLITKDEPVDELMLILDGEVEVFVDESLTVRLSHFRLLGEVSSLRGSLATANVSTLTKARLRCWNKDELNACAVKHPTVQVALLRAMGQEVARKLG